MKILHIVNVQAIANGITSVVVNLMKYQQMLGCMVKAINLNKTAESIQDIDKIYGKKEFISIVETFNPDIVIFHGIFYKEIITFSSILRRRSTPYLIQLHGAYSRMNYRHNKCIKYIFKKCFLSKCIKSSHGVIFLNERERNNCVLLGLMNKTIILPNGCEINSNLGGSRWMNKSKTINLLYIGRIDIHHKGLDLLVGALKKEINIPDYKIRLNIYGAGSREDVNFIKNSLKDATIEVEYHPAVYGRDKDIIFRKSNILLLTSRYEGFPMTLLEGWSYGLPSLITPETNMSDIVIHNNCGWVTSPNIDAINANLIKAINEYINDKAGYYTRSIETAKYYEWSKIAKLSINLYKTLISYED